VIRRPRRVVPASIVALVVLAVMVLLVWSCVQVLLGRQPVLPFAELGEQGAGLTWNAVPVLVTGGALAALGLVLLVCAWLPGTPNVLPLAAVDGDTGRTRTGATRRGIRQAVAMAAGRVDGVSTATAQVTPGRIRTTVRTSLNDAGALPGQVRAAVDGQLSTIALRRAPKVSVRVNRTRSTR
jgi:Family of unknown function (DUF6286)